MVECLNTAIESIVNFTSPNKKLPLAKKAKDTASAAVYIAIWNAIVSALFIITFK
jgi:diacylglycerol kinase